MTNPSVPEGIAKARAGANPAVVCRLPSGWVLLGDSQFLPGYCMLYADPVAESLNTISGWERAQFLEDLSLVGDAVLSVTSARRMNYSILGNVLPVLHGHAFPRYDTEDEAFRTGPIWLYPDAKRNERPFDPVRDAPLMKRIHDRLVELEAKVAGQTYPWQVVLGLAPKTE
ncbi:MAG: hypothetical protein R3E97_13020 [Candidatus Eisenbacteria bacterium]